MTVQKSNNKAYATLIEARRVLANKRAIGQFNWIITRNEIGWYTVVKA
jgi:hypothetical protein